MRQSIVAIIVLLLSLTTDISAQERPTAQTLEGLGEIGLIVKYGQADGISEVIQPTLLQKLHDRAKDLLREGEVPLLESTDEAGMLGRPRLVVTVRLKKQNDTPPAVRIESELYQRVRLSRDPAKELEVLTWSTGRVASEIREEMLFSLLDEQLYGFVKTYRAMNAKSPRAETPIAESLEPIKDNANPLEGLNGIRVMVSLAFNRVEGARLVDLGPRLSDPEIQKTFQSEAERKLKQAGIPLLRNETDRPGHPLFTVSMTLSQSSFDNHSPAIGVVSTFWQDVRLVRNPQKETYTETWKSRASEDWPITEDAILKVMNSQLDEFIKAYKAGNPRLSTAK